MKGPRVTSLLDSEAFWNSLLSTPIGLHLLWAVVSSERQTGPFLGHLILKLDPPSYVTNGLWLPWHSFYFSFNRFALISLSPCLEKDSKPVEVAHALVFCFLKMRVLYGQARVACISSPVVPALERLRQEDHLSLDI